MRHVGLDFISLVSLILAVPSGALAMEIDQTHVMTGVDAAVARMAEHIGDFDKGIDTDETENLIIEVFANYEEEEQWSPKAIHFAAEVIGVGALSRIHYKEPELTHEQAAELLPVLNNIWNSWKHGGPR